MAQYEWSITFVDTAGKSATAQGFINAADQAGAVAIVQGIAEALNDPTPTGTGALPLTLGKITDVKVALNVDFSTWAIRSVAVAGAENQKGGRFLFMTALGFTTRLTIPTFNEALILPSRDIDLSNPAVFAFYDTAIIAGGGADNRYADLISLKEAYLTLGGKDARK